MRYFLPQLDYPDKAPEVTTAPEPKIVRHASYAVQHSDHILGASLHPDKK